MAAAYSQSKGYQREHDKTMSFVIQTLKAHTVTSTIASW